MKNNLVFSLLLFFAMFCKSQNTCGSAFIKDTLYIPTEARSFAGEYLEAVLKNKSLVRLYKLNSNRYFLELIVTENLYFDKVDQLEIQSGSKSSYEPKIKQHELNKSTGFYVFEVFKNYIGTLKEDGITAIVFGKVTTDFTRQDANQIKQISKCFYDTFLEKK